MQGFGFRFCMREIGDGRFSITIGTRKDGQLPRDSAQADYLTQHDICNKTTPCVIEMTPRSYSTDAFLNEQHKSLARSIVDKVGLNAGCFEVSLEGSAEEFVVNRIRKY